MAWISSAKGRCWCHEPCADTTEGVLGQSWACFWDGRKGIQTAMAWETKLSMLGIDVAEQGASREKQIQAGTAHVGTGKVGSFSTNWTQAEQRIL